MLPTYHILRKDRRRNHGCKNRRKNEIDDCQRQQIAHVTLFALELPDLLAQEKKDTN